MGKSCCVLGVIDNLADLPAAVLPLAWCSNPRFERKSEKKCQVLRCDRSLFVSVHGVSGRFREALLHLDSKHSLSVFVSRNQLRLDQTPSRPVGVRSYPFRDGRWRIHGAVFLRGIGNETHDLKIGYAMFGHTNN